MDSENELEGFKGQRVGGLWETKGEYYRGHGLNGALDVVLKQ